MKKSSYFFGLVSGGAFLCASMARGQAPSQAGAQFFESKIRPVLVSQCYQCHSSQAKKLKGGFSLEFHETMLRGGDSGPAIVPGNPEKSLLIKAIRYTDPDLKMPPNGTRLSEAQIADFITWIRMGAPDTRIMANGTTASWSKDRRDHWSFKPLKSQTIPTVQDPDWVANPVDAFILARLEKEGMKPSPPADKRALIRRATYDLTGLPPTPEEVQAFVDDTSSNAYPKLVDRLLASPQYGERWGRYWLDTARYADTKGEIKQNREAPLYPYAWTYRDYVVRSFNDDKPYNRFILEQLAADKLLSVKDKDKSSLAALGFLTLGPRFMDNKDDIYNDRIDVVCKGLLGLTVTCARCHDHKFDPIPQKDYYSLRGVFDSSEEPDEEPLLETPKMTPEYQAYLIERKSLNQTLLQEEAEFKRSRRMMANQKQKKDVQKEIGDTRRNIAQLELADPGSPACATALIDKPRPQDSSVFVRGVPENRGEIAPRRFLEILSKPNRAPFTNGSGRLDLARSIANPANPLTARVLVNRVWLHHFGEGFVTTPDDLGNQSEPPSHPELLDYLALRFMQDGWSIKKLHRLIMLSNTYQESSANNPRYAQIDPRNRLLWRANIHRLEFEAVRDSILAMGGQLDMSMGGRPVELGLGEGGFSHRRTIYGKVDRRNLPELYNQFDFANPNLTTGKRYETTVPQQALFMMNNPLVVELARRLVDERGFKVLVGDDAKVKFLYEHIFQREPTEVEVKLGLDFIDDSPADEKISPDARAQMREQRQDRMNAGNGKKKGGRAMTVVNLRPDQIHSINKWVKYAHALLQTNEAIFVN